MRSHFSAAICALLVAGGTTLLSQQGFIPAPSGVRLAEPWRPATNDAATRVVGRVVDIRHTAVADARLQLVNLNSGLIESEKLSDENGHYEFQVDTPSSYVVKMVLVDGFVVALSRAGTVARYETMRVDLILPGTWDNRGSRVVPLQNVSSYFGMSSQTTMTAATLQLAADSNISTADAGEPVSP